MSDTFRKTPRRPREGGDPATSVNDTGFPLSRERRPRIGASFAYIILNNHRNDNTAAPVSAPSRNARSASLAPANG